MWTRTGLRNAKAPDRGTELLLLDRIASTPTSEEYAKLRKEDEKTTYWTSWRVTLAWQIALATIVFFVNFGITIWIGRNFETIDGVATVSQGSCSQVKSTVTGLHLTICVVSTLLLGSCNYCMQILSAPTREELDAAHARHQWLSIGVPSPGNLRHISRLKVAVWFDFGLTSIPLHLLWNSVVVSTLGTNGFVSSAVTEDFLTGAEWQSRGDDLTEYTDHLTWMSQPSQLSAMVTLNSTACMAAYSAPILSQYSNLFLVYDTKAADMGNNSLLAQQEFSDLYIVEGPGWLCNGFGLTGNMSNATCDVDVLMQNNESTWNPLFHVNTSAALTWDYGDSGPSFLGINGTVEFSQDGSNLTLVSGPNNGDYGYGTNPIIKYPDLTIYEYLDVTIYEYPSVTIWRYPNATGYYHPNITGNIKYCLAETTENGCRLQISPTILAVVLVCNALKIACFCLTLYIGRYTMPLLTNGDVTESYLLCPDAAFRNRCLASVGVMMQSKTMWSASALPLHWNTTRTRWFAGAPHSCWWATMWPAMAFVIFGGVGLFSEGKAAILKGGFGEPNPQFLLGGSRLTSLSTLSASMVANSPQIVFSYIYVACNTLFTYLLSNVELVSYSSRAKFLGVQWPKGKQRSRGFLQLPYHYSFALIVASATLHWLVSESVFLVRILPFTYEGKEDPDSTISGVGYSPLASLIAVSFGALMLLVVLLLGYCRKYPATMPLAAGCSVTLAAISQGKGNFTIEDVTQKKLQWGVLRPPSADVTGSEIGRAGFSTGKVSPLVRGAVYI